MWRSAVGEVGNLGEFLPPRPAAKAARSARSQCVCASASTDMAVRSIGRSRRTRRSTSPSSSMTLGAGTCTAARPDCALTSSAARGSSRAIQRLGERERPIALAPADGEDLGLRAGLRMDVDRAPIGHDQALGGQRLDARRRRCPTRCAPSILACEQLLERPEQRVLQIDGQRQQPIEEGGDRRQLLAQAAVLIGQRAGRWRPRSACSEQPSTLPANSSR